MLEQDCSGRARGARARCLLSETPVKDSEGQRSRATALPLGRRFSARVLGDTVGPALADAHELVHEPGASASNAGARRAPQNETGGKAHHATQATPGSKPKPRIRGTFSSWSLAFAPRARAAGRTRSSLRINARAGHHLLVAPRRDVGVFQHDASSPSSCSTPRYSHRPQKRRATQPARSEPSRV